MSPSFVLILSLSPPFLWVKSFSSQTCLRRHPSACLRQWAVPPSILRDVVDGTTTAQIDRGYGTLYANTPKTMTPLSCPPLLLLQSSSPVISRECCSLLSRYFEQLERDSPNDSIGNEECSVISEKMDDYEINMAKKMLCEIQDVIDEVTNCQRHDGESQIPRYVRYDPKMADISRVTDTNASSNDQGFLSANLLPDGLHVDTNNGKLFRHITVILYLTDNEDGFLVDDRQYDFYLKSKNACVVGGGTTFPLAIPLDRGKHVLSERIENAAKNLLSRGIQHTKADKNKEEDSDGRCLEREGLGIFLRDNKVVGDISGLGQYGNQHTSGIRVMPEAGKLIYFHNLGNDGMPDSLSFHGGEELIAFLDQLDNDEMMQHYAKVANKSILVFFKEISMDTFQDEDGFAEQARNARAWTQHNYF